MSKLQQYQINEIRDIYSDLKSIEATVKKTGYSRVTVNKYVKDMSCKSKNSQKAIKKEIFKIDLDSNMVIAEYRSISMASQDTDISESNICHCLSGRTVSAGGYRWRYKKY